MARAIQRDVLAETGVTLSHLGPLHQLSFLGDADQPARTALTETLDKLRERHGLFVVSRATHLTREKRKQPTSAHGQGGTQDGD